MLDKENIKNEIKVLYELDESQDAKLDILIDRGIQAVWDICNLEVEYSGIEDIPKDFEGIIAELVAFDWNRLGREDKVSQSGGNLNHSYVDDIPKPLKRKLYKRRFMRFF